MGFAYFKFMAVVAMGVALCAQPLTIYTEIFPPDQFIGPGGQLTGLSIEILREIQRRTHNQDPIQVVSWARGYHEALTRPDVVLLSMARSAERDALFEWIGPIKESRSCLYVRSDSKIVLAELMQARNLQRIGVYKDDVRDQFLTQAGFTNLDRSVDQGIILKKLMAGRVDAMACVPDSLGNLLRAEGLAPDCLRPACAFLETQVFIALSKGTRASVLQAWSEAFRGMKKDGTFRRIQRKYYP